MVSGKEPYEGLERELSLITDYRSLPIKTPEDKIIEEARRFAPDIIFFQIQRAGVISVETFKELASICPKIINWTGDVRTPIPQFYIDLAPYCITSFSNMTDVNEMSQYEEFKTAFLQIGYDPKVFYKQDDVEKDIDIIFMGNSYSSSKFPLSQYRIDMVDRLKKEFGERFKLYGSGWPNSDGGCNGNQAEECDLYNRAKIGINLSHFNYDNYSSDRMYRLMGSGTFCLSHSYNKIEEDFECRALDTWSDFDELIAKCKKYLEHEMIREDIADIGRLYVNSKYSYKQMAENILKL